MNVGKKYSHDDVNRLYKMVERNCTLPFIFYCMTDNNYGLLKEIVEIKVDLSLDLESYWWKICLFDLKWDKSILYLDLDVIIQNNIDYIFKETKSTGFTCLSIEDAGIYYPFDGRNADNILLIPPVEINSSVMFFNPSNYQQVFDSFVENTDYNIIHYYGLDRFIPYQITDISYFNFSKDYYYRGKGQESYDSKYVVNGLIHDPNKTFCIMNQCKSEHYRGLEKYFI